jgi:hypothetical protein
MIRYIWEEGYDAESMLYGSNGNIGECRKYRETRPENPRVGGSIPPLGTINFNDLAPKCL